MCVYTSKSNVCIFSFTFHESELLIKHHTSVLASWQLCHVHHLIIELDVSISLTLKECIKSSESHASLKQLNHYYFPKSII